MMSETGEDTGAARAAAAAAQAGDDESALAYARRAVQEGGELFHPDLWVPWARASDEAFEKAVALASVSEGAALGAAQDAAGVRWALRFGLSARKLRALRGLGLGPQWPDENFLEAAYQAGREFCEQGQISGLAALAEAGFPPPGSLGEEDEEGPWEPFHALAQSSGWWRFKWPEERLRAALSWISESEGALGAEDESGDDALKMALCARLPQLPEALLDAGADPWTKNKKQETAFDFFETALARDQAARRGAGVASVEPRMRALKEAGEIEALMRGVEKTGAKARI